MFLVASKVLEMDDMASVMSQLGLYFVTVCVGLFIQGFIVLPVLYFALTRQNPITYITNMGQAIATAFGTASRYTYSLHLSSHIEFTKMILTRLVLQHFPSQSSVWRRIWASIHA